MHIQIDYIFDVGVNLKYTQQFMKICLCKTTKIIYRNNNNNNMKIGNMLVLPFNKKLAKTKNIFKMIIVNLVSSFKK